MEPRGVGWIGPETYMYTKCANIANVHQLARMGENPTHEQTKFTSALSLGADEAMSDHCYRMPVILGRDEVPHELNSDTVPAALRLDRPVARLFAANALQPPRTKRAVEVARHWTGGWANSDAIMIESGASG